MKSARFFARPAVAGTLAAALVLVFGAEAGAQDEAQRNAAASGGQCVPGDVVSRVQECPSNAPKLVTLHECVASHDVDAIWDLQFKRRRRRR